MDNIFLLSCYWYIFESFCTLWRLATDNLRLCIDWYGVMNNDRLVSIQFVAWGGGINLSLCVPLLNDSYKLYFTRQVLHLYTQFRLVPLTIVAMEKRYVLRILSVCRQPHLTIMQSACAVWYFHLWSVWLYSIFPYCFTNSTILGEKILLHKKCVF